MILYIADRMGKILETVSTTKNQIIADTLKDDIKSGFKTLEATIKCEETTKENIIVGNLAMLGGKNYELFTITETLYSAFDNAITIYCEDAGLDLINKTVGEYKGDNVKLEDAVNHTLQGAGGWNVEYGINKNNKADIEYTSEDTVVSRLIAIAKLYKAEIFFDYQINGFKLISRTLQIVESRGRTTPEHSFLFGRDLTNVIEKANISNVATAFSLYGKDDKPLKKMKDYSTYEGDTITPEDSRFSGKRTHTYKVVGNEVRCIDAMKEWKSTLDSDGKILQVKKTEYPNAKKLIAYAMRELEKKVEIKREYEVEFAGIPEDIDTGDYINIIDNKGDIQIKTRVLEWTKSEVSNSFTATIGEYEILEGSKIDEPVEMPSSEDSPIDTKQDKLTTGAYIEIDEFNVIKAVNVQHLLTAGTNITIKDNVISAIGGAVSGVKGNAETSYRIGNVNLTAANIGVVEYPVSVDYDKDGWKVIKYNTGKVEAWGSQTDTVSFVAISNIARASNIPFSVPKEIFKNVPEVCEVTIQNGLSLNFAQCGAMKTPTTGVYQSMRATAATAVITVYFHLISFNG